jgi:Ni/Co efflux regulator RcnB
MGVRVRVDDANNLTMPTPRHRQRAVRRRRRARFAVALAAAAVVAGLIARSATDDGSIRVAARTDPTVQGSHVQRSTTTTEAFAAGSTASSSTSISTSTSTSTTALPAQDQPSGWYAVVLSGPKDGTSRAGLEREVEPYGDRGSVIDTDRYQTGDGLGPRYLPRAGVLAAVVGPFAGYDETRTWCELARSGNGDCNARQLIPR